MVRTINREPQPKTTVPGARLHTGYWGKFPIGSILGGCKFFVTLIDEATGYAFLLPLSTKAGVRPWLVNTARALVVEGRVPLVVVRADNVKEYLAALNDLKQMGATMEFVSTYTAYQNGIAERFNRTVITIARAMLIHSKLPLSFWAEAVVYACHIYNRLPQGSRGSESPWELWSEKKPNLTNERVFGCQCRVYMAKEQRDTKLSPLSWLGIYTGYHSSTQYRVYRPDKNKFEWPTNVRFYEDRSGRALLPKSALPKFDWLRADYAPMDPAT